MADLKALFQDLGYSEPLTYIQSGNVIFGTDRTNEQDVVWAIEGASQVDFDLEVRVLLRSHEELQRIAHVNPFLEQGVDASKLYVTFLAESRDTSSVGAIAPSLAGPDEFVVSGREVYLHYPEGYGGTKLSNAFWERRLNTMATTRNWNTVTKLAHLSGR